MPSETAAQLRRIRSDWKDARTGHGRLARMPDVGTQIFPLDCADRVECLWVPPYFWKYCLWMNPLQGFWEYQIKAFDHLFHCWYTQTDGTLRQARQTGKTTTMPLPLSFLIQEEHIQLVVISTKLEKTRKLTRPVRRAMARMDERLEVDSLDEARFLDESGYRSLSGSEDAKKESETAHIIVIDEAQDIPYSPTYKEISPMRKGVGGIIFAMGIGGPEDSMMMRLIDQPDVENVNIEYDQIPERPAYKEDVEKERYKMLASEFEANYRGARTSRNANTLIEEILEWSELFPNMPFNSDVLEDIEIGVDFAQVQDNTVAIASGFYGDVCVIFDVDWYARGEATDVQLEGLTKFFMRVPFNALRPEVNNLGRWVVQDLKRMLAEELKKTDYKGDPEKLWAPVTVNDHNIDTAIRSIHELSATRHLCYVVNGADGKNPHMKRCIADLRNVQAKKTRSGKLANSHSDFFAALRTRFCGRRIARLAS